MLLNYSKDHLSKSAKLWTSWLDHHSPLTAITTPARWSATKKSPFTIGNSSQFFLGELNIFSLSRFWLKSKGMETFSDNKSKGSRAWLSHRPDIIAAESMIKIAIPIMMLMLIMMTTPIICDDDNQKNCWSSIPSSFHYPRRSIFQHGKYMSIVDLSLPVFRIQISSFEVHRVFTYSPWCSTFPFVIDVNVSRSFIPFCFLINLNESHQEINEENTAEHTQ